MRTNRIASTLTVIGVVAALAGCGSGSTATQSAGASSSITTTTTLNSSTPTNGASSSATSTTTSSGSATHSGTSGSSTTTSSPTSSSQKGSAAAKPSKPAFGKLALASAAFPHGGKIPVRYTCDGANVSPPLQWGKVPSGTAQLFLLALSLTGGAQGAIRWAVGGIDPRSGGFAAGRLPAGAVVGRGSDGHTGWAGICPSRGKLQNMILLVYALRNKLNLAPGFDPRVVQRRLTGNTVGTGVVFGAYRRP